MNDLQRQLQAAKKEAADVAEQYASFKDEMSEVQETIEMATLDKEMAEEKCESLQQEIDQWKEKAEELSLDLQLLKEDMQTPAEGTFSTFEKKQLEQQNERLKEAIVKVRELSNFEKQETLKLQKLVEVQKTELASLEKDKERLDSQVKKLLEEAIELKEQVDSSQGAEEMVEKLTEKTLKQEEIIEKLEEEKADLEALCEMNDELQETARETELELRESLDMSNMRCSETLRKNEALNETIIDYQKTIEKFRDLVGQLQQDITANNTTTTKAPTPTIEFDFKTKFAETKAISKAIDMELRKLDVEQANKHVAYLCSFMPDNFLKRGGDHDAVLTLLLIPRMISKCDLLMTQVKEKFDIPEEIARADVVETQKSEGFVFACNITYSICVLQAYLKQYEYALNTCAVDMLLKIGTLLPEIAVHEKSLDYYVDLLRKDKLDETTSTDLLDKAIQYFEHLYSVHLTQYKPNCAQLMAVQMQTLHAVANFIGTSVHTLKLSLKPSEMQSLSSPIVDLLNFLEEQNNELKNSAKKVKRRLPDNPASANPMSFSDQIEKKMSESLESLGKLLKIIKMVCAACGQLIVVMAGHES
ncbi:hypothetical protein HELRODRAFT_102242, partial [Helobdella robusta]|uniref:Dynein associated protein domain-containing protein n=1 Tax=Helobdella robusta TaxID=6412 RepID=T1ED88_HELRO